MATHKEKPWLGSTWAQESDTSYHITEEVVAGH